MIHCLILVNAAEFLSEFTVGQKQAQPFVFISSSVFIEDCFDLHDFLLYPGVRTPRFFLLLVMVGRFAGL